MLYVSVVFALANVQVWENVKESKLKSPDYAGKCYKCKVSVHMSSSSFCAHTLTIKPRWLEIYASLR